MRVMKQADRTVPFVLSVYFLSASFALFGIWRDDAGLELFYEWLWPWVFLAAGMTTLAYSAFPKNRYLCVWSGGFMVAAVLSRAVSLMLAWSDGILQWGEAWLRATSWCVLGFLIGYMWNNLMSKFAAARNV